MGWDKSNIKLGKRSKTTRRVRVKRLAAELDIVKKKLE
jgi:hypothetical protein